LERICHFVLYRSFEQDLSSLCWAIDVDLIVVVRHRSLGMGSHSRVKMAREPVSRRRALRSGRRQHGTGRRIRNGQVDATIWVIFRVAEHCVHGMTHPTRIRFCCLFHERAGPMMPRISTLLVRLKRFAAHLRIHPVLPYAPIPPPGDRCTYCTGPNSFGQPAPESVGLLLK